MIFKDKSIKDLEGLSFEAGFNWKKDNKIMDSRIGEAIFTADGLSGPVVLAASGKIARSLPGVRLAIDFFPDEDMTALDLKLQKIFSANSNRQVKNALVGLLPPRLITVLLPLVKITLEAKVNQTVKDDRRNLAKLLKSFELEVKAVEGFNKAMMTSGGVDLGEVNSSTMRSKIISNLYLAGEILDLDGPTGGFNLQLCWSTGRLAGESAVKE